MQEAIAMHEDVLTSFLKKDTSGFKNITKRVSSLQDMANKHDNEAIKLVAKYQPEGDMLRTIVANLKITNEIVRIGVGAKVFIKNGVEILQTGFNFSPYESEIKSLYKTSIDALKLTHQAYTKEAHRDFVSTIKAKESITDEYYQFLQDSMISSVLTKGVNAKHVFEVLRMMRKLERLADHALNIAVLTEFAIYGGKLESF